MSLRGLRTLVDASLKGDHRHLVRRLKEVTLEIIFLSFRPDSDRVLELSLRFEESLGADPDLDLVARASNAIVEEVDKLCSPWPIRALPDPRPSLVKPESIT